jgi:hypothetical protein
MIASSIKSDVSYLATVDAFTHSSFSFSYSDDVFGYANG